MELLDWVVIALFMAVLIGIVVWVMKKGQERYCRLLFGRSRCDMDCHRGIDICVEHRFGALGQLGRSGRFERYGDGPLGNSGMAHSVAGMGVCAVLQPEYGVYHAGVFGEALQFAVADNSFGDFADQLRADQK